MNKQTECFLMLGSNMGNRANNLEEAISLLSTSVGELLVKSEIFESEPWGYEEEVSYYNMAVMVSTFLEPKAVLTECLSVEDKLGRVRTKNSYEARPIDIDILFYEDSVINEPELTIPHPRISERRFVLEPLHSIAPELIHPVFNASIEKLLHECPDSCWVKVLK